MRALTPMGRATARVIAGAAAVLLLLATPGQAGEPSDLVLIDPIDEASLTSRPVFAWDESEYELFLLYTVFYYKWFGYVPFALLEVENWYLMPEGWFAMLGLDEPSAWAVIGIDLDDFSYAVSEIRTFTKTDQYGTLKEGGEYGPYRVTELIAEPTALPGTYKFRAESATLGRVTI